MNLDKVIDELIALRDKVSGNAKVIVRAGNTIVANPVDEIVVTKGRVFINTK